MSPHTFQHPINFCTEITHNYTCGHTKKDKAPCAGKKSGVCSGKVQKTVIHNEQCSGHDKWSSRDLAATEFSSFFNSRNASIIIKALIFIQRTRKWYSAINYRE
ncbi:hypothetical protein ABVK25_003040 [Lepraria finkii]|uniref:Uncharacterized protein n=1 Tax=Lepraria finkii TaxID=1340010 RepID=A0ABR4BHY1_9LECA